MTAATVPVARTGRPVERQRFRTDIQGLRAVAVVLVLAYHAGLPWVPGGYIGVDVFFVISGFLITSLILREIELTGTLSLRRFYARRARRWRAGVVAVVCVGVGLGAAAAVNQLAQRSAAGADGPARSVEGARALGPGPDATYDGPDTGDFRPTVLAAPDDLQQLDGQDCIANPNVPIERCSHGPDDAELVIALAGDSKLHQWLPALQGAADSQGWRLETYLYNGCPLVDVPVVRGDGPYLECSDANVERLAALEDADVDVVLVSQVAVGAHVDGAGSTERRQVMADGLTRTWTRLTEAAKQVVVLADNPPPPRDMIECVATHEDQLTACAFDADGPETTAVEVARGMDLPVVDLTPWICPGGTCWPVIGDALVYRQGSHLTSTYAESLTEHLERELVDAGLR